MGFDHHYIWFRKRQYVPNIRLDVYLAAMPNENQSVAQIHYRIFYPRPSIGPLLPFSDIVSRRSKNDKLMLHDYLNIDFSRFIHIE